MGDNIYDFLLRKRNVKLLLIRFLLYQRIFEFCFLLLTPNSVLYYTVTPNAASACKNCRKSQTRNTARAMCAPQNHPNYPSYHLQNQEGWSTETHFFEMEPGPTASKKETITPSSTIPYLKAIQISARSEPISPSYDINEFVHFYNKESHQNFTNFDRPEEGRKIFFFYSFFTVR